MVISGVFWVFCSFMADLLKNHEMVLFWTKAAIIGPALLATLFYSFSLVFPVKEGKETFLKNALAFIPTTLFLILAPTALNVEEVVVEEWGVDFTPGPLYYLLFAHLVVNFLLAIRNLRRAHHRVKTRVERHQILFICSALLGALIIGLSTNLVLPLLGFARYSKYGPSLAILFFTALTSIAILRHRLLDIRVILTEALVFILIGISTVRIPVSRTANETTFNLIILALTIAVGVTLIRSTNKEIRRREEMEKISTDLKKAYRELKKLDVAKTEFISIASHQLRTPLTAIKGYVARVLAGSYGKIPESAKKSLDNVYHSNERLIRLVNDLLSVSRIETGKLELVLEEVSLEEMLTSIIEELSIKAKDKDIFVKWKKPKEALPKITADRNKIRQVFFNIVDNAIKYTDTGGITIETAQKNSSLVTEIADTGLGLTRKEKEHLFESFSRGKAGAQYWPEGIGLGLYISKRLVDMHKGKVWAKSPGKEKGSTFYVSLPIK
jgi:signal transduction histidine kinase